MLHPKNPSHYFFSYQPLALILLILPHMQATPSPDIAELSYELEAKNSLATYLAQAKGLTMVFFYRVGCPYCQKFLKEYPELAMAYREAPVGFGQVRLSDNTEQRTYQKERIEALYRIKINSFPCLVIFRDQHIIEVLQGNQEERSLPRLHLLLDEKIEEGEEG